LASGLPSSVELQDAGIASRALGIARRQDIKQLLYGSAVVDVAGHQTPIVQSAVLGLGDKLLGERPRGLRLGACGADALMAEKRRRKAAQQSHAMACRALELKVPLTVPHRADSR
jgi:hypothetical protein